MTEDEKGTNGLNGQDVHNIKVMFYAKNTTVGSIADDLGFTVMQVMYAINLNETDPVKFTEKDFAV